MAVQQFKAVGEMDMGKGLIVKTSARQFEILIDEPEELGGLDTGMTPVEVLLGSLASCKAIVVKSFARLHRIKLESISIECIGDLDPDGFLLKTKKRKKASRTSKPSTTSRLTIPQKKSKSSLLLSSPTVP